MSYRQGTMPRLVHLPAQNKKAHFNRLRSMMHWAWTPYNKPCSELPELKSSSVSQCLIPTGVTTAQCASAPHAPIAWRDQTCHPRRRSAARYSPRQPAAPSPRQCNWRRRSSSKPGFEIKKQIQGFASPTTTRSFSPTCRCAVSPFIPTLLAPYGGTCTMCRGDNTLVILLSPEVMLITLGAGDRCNNGVKAWVTTATEVVYTFMYSLYMARIAERSVS